MGTDSTDAAWLSAHGLAGHPFPHILIRDEFTCQLCGDRRNLEVHHIEPRARGGGDGESNLVTLCRACHDVMHGVHWHSCDCPSREDRSYRRGDE